MPLVRLVRVVGVEGEPYGLVYGQLVSNPAQVAVAAMEMEGILLLVAEAHRQEGPYLLDMPDDVVFEVIELGD